MYIYIQVIYESTHFYRLYHNKWNWKSREAPILARCLKHILENCRRSNEVFDLTNFVYRDPLEYLKAFKGYFADQRLRKMQIALQLYLQLQATEDLRLSGQLRRKLDSMSQVFDEFKALYVFIMSNFSAPFNLKILHLFQKGNTWDSWIKIENHCKFTVKKKESEYEISFPGFAAPAAVVTILNEACQQQLPSEYNSFRNHCYQSTRQLQFDLLAFHHWHEDAIIYQHPSSPDATPLMDSSKSVWKKRLKMLGCVKTLRSLYNNKYACTGGTQMVSNQNEKYHCELKMWLPFYQTFSPQMLSFYLSLTVVKHNWLCFKRMRDKPERYPSIPEWYLDSLSSQFDDIFMFTEMFDHAHEHGYQFLIIKPFQKKDFKYFYEAGVVKRPLWNHRHTRKLIHFLRSDLKIFDNPDVPLTEDIIYRCYKDVFNETFEIEMITNKLQLHLLKYIYIYIYKHIYIYVYNNIICIQQQYMYIYIYICT